MSKKEKQTDNEAALHLAAARLLLGDELALRLVADQWNAVNELSDPYQQDEHSARFSLSAADLAVKVLSRMSDALKAPMMDLSERKITAMDKIPEEERKAWLKGDTATPEAYAAEMPEPLFGEPRLLLRELTEKTAEPGEFLLGTPAVMVVCRKRPNGTAWISVGNSIEGPHFQCDYHGDIETGPIRRSDFACNPPQWVIKRLGLT